MGVDYRVLGRLEVTRDGAAIDLGAFRQRALLALLLTHAGKVLSTDRILDELWGGAGAIDKQSSLWVYVSGLRAALEPARAKRSEGTVLLTRPPGYVLTVERDQTDVGRFERSLAESRILLDTDPGGAGLALRAALATWRGHAYEEFAYESWAQTEIARLEEVRLEAIEHRIDADLRLGQSRELVSELQSLVREHPLRERFVMSLMLALYRSGRTAEALRASSSYRQLLVTDVGIEPSRALRDLEHDLLVDDGHLLIRRDTADRPLRPRSGLTVRGYELREEIGRGGFGAVFRAYQPIVGREVAIKVIKPGLADDPGFIRRFEAEAQLVAGLEHPHIVPLFDYWREPGAAYLVMRLVRDGNLADVLGDGGLPTDRAASLFAQVAGALSLAHRNGVAHGDLRPESILVDGEGFAYVTDFGVAVGADEEAQPSAPFAAPEQLAGRAPSPASDQYSLAVVAATALTGLRGGFEQLRGALGPGVRSVLNRATASDPERRYADVTTFGQALIDALGATESTVLDATAENPYKGLRAFSSADAGDFFGRERLVERLIARLGAPGNRGRFLALVGPSGSGKSSAVRAGLLPALARGALGSSTDWLRIDMTPAPHPFEQLESALVRIAPHPPNTLLDLMLTPGGLRRAVHRVLPADDDQLLLVVDQFEELYTQVDDETATRFIDELVELVVNPATRTHVVITLRADFYDRPLRHRGLGELLREGTEVITPMSVEELEAAIVGPAEKVGVEVEPLAVTEMVREAIDRVGALPLLQYTLTELFESRAGRTITLSAYRAGGGVSRTLARRADSLLAGSGSDMTETARRVLLRLVSVDDDSNAVATRRRAHVIELEELDRPGRVRRLLDTFGRHRLLTFDRDPVSRGPTVEISHEALLTEWDTLGAWIDEARDDLRRHRQLVGDLNAWAAAGQSHDYLLRGGRLDAVDGWAASTTIGLRAAEREFLQASLDARTEDRRVRDEEERRTAAAERTARRRSRQLALAAVTVAAVVALATFAWVQRQDARDAESDLAANQSAQRLANLSVTSLSRDPQLSLLLAMEAVRSTSRLGYAVPEAIDATHWALQELGVQYDVTADTPTATRAGPDGVQGVWVLPVEELMHLAEASTDRALSAEECDQYLGRRCRTPASVTGVEYLGGVDAYTGVAGATAPEVVIALSATYEFQAEEYERNLDVIGERYGLDPRLEQIPLHLRGSEEATQGRGADIFVLSFAGELPQLAADRPLLDLRAVVDEATLRDDYGAYLLSLSRVGADGAWPSDTGPIHGVFVGADSKALMWTNEPEFTDLGYQAPHDWESLLTLSDRIVADGRTPFCLGIASGDYDGWPATDWVEMVVLRTGGPELYDAWIQHDVPFDHPVVVDAISTVGALAHTDGYLDTSPDASALRAFGDALLAFSQEPDKCLMTPFPSFLPGILEAGTDLSVGSFAFPAFGTAHDDGVVGGGGLAVAVTDRPEVRRLMAALASPEWGIGAAQLDWPLLLPANRRFDLADVANPEIAEIVAGMQTAIGADNFRFDGSDSMPVDVGRAFSQGMMRLFREGSSANLDDLSLDIARAVETTWLDLETSETGDG